MERESFVFYRSFFDAAETLENGDKILFYQMIARYALDGVLPDACRSPAYGMFLLVKPQVDANARRYENGKKGAEYGKLGGRPKKPLENPKETPRKPKENPKETPNVNANVNDNVNVNGSRAKPTRFVPPTIEQVQEYIREKGYTVDAERFIDFYSSKGWMVGKNKMKDWKASVRTWAREKKPEKKQSKFVNYEQRETDYDALFGIGG